jgi:uncharacterized membrane protein YjfL (UPF0719 family)
VIDSKGVAAAPLASNAARGIVQAGFVCGVAFVAASAINGCVHGQDWRSDLVRTLVIGGSAVLVLAVAGSLGIRVLLRSRLPAEIARGNLAAGVAAGAHYAATGLIVAECFYGDYDARQLGISVAFFDIAQVTLHVFLMLFRSLTLYAEDQEIIGENVAAALSYAGAMLALAVIVGHAAQGDFAGWEVSLRGYVMALASALVLYPVRQLVVQTLLLRQPFALRGGALDRLIAQERNVGVSAVEGVSYLAAAFLLAGIA